MRSADALGKYLRIKLQATFDICGTISINEIRNSDGIKGRILSDPLFKVNLVNSNSFKVCALPTDISESIIRDYYFGYIRAKKQWNSVQLLVKSGKYAAWSLVTAYYAAYFSAIEALRICGHIPLTLSGKEKIPILNLPADKNNFSGVIGYDLSEIGFMTSGGKSHQVIWNSLQKNVLSKLPIKVCVLPEMIAFKGICSSNKSWELPSSIRNRWNYRDAIYFDSYGENLSSEFIKIIKDKDAASDWIIQNTKLKSESDSINSIAALANLLFWAIDDSYQHCFINNVEKRI
jgi:hypothetical protein